MHSRAIKGIAEHNAAERVERFVKDELPSCVCPPLEGRGIVIAAGGLIYNTNAWVLIRMLRRLGCRLPIQCWFLGPKERDESWIDLVRPYNVTCVDARQLAALFPHERLNGWELKGYAIMRSPFREVIFFDADNVPIVDPTFLFETKQFRSTGAIFWPDTGKLERNRPAWHVFGNIPFRDEPAFESGQIVIDKTRCWPALELADWYMQNSALFFRYVHGDKDVFHMAWMKLGLNYSMPSRGVERLGGTFCQHDFDGRRIFQHRTRCKWTLQKNVSLPGFEFERECLAFLEELRGIMLDARLTK